MIRSYVLAWSFVLCRLIGKVPALAVLGELGNGAALGWLSWMVPLAIVEVVMFVHGDAVFAWIVLLVMQVSLVHTRRLDVHRRLGLLSLALVPLIVVSTAQLGVFVMHRDLAAGLGEIATSTLVGTITTPLMFTAPVAAALHYRRQPEFHKRLMWLATVAILWLAFFRFRHYFPPMQRPDIWFGFVPPALVVLGSMLWDRLAIGRVHPAYLIAGTAVIAESLLEVLLFDSAGWRVLGHWLAERLA